jgi:hypothetical protein
VCYHTGRIGQVGVMGARVTPAPCAQAQDLCVHLAAERERAVNRDDTRLPFALYVSTAVDAVTGLLAAPASAETAGLIAGRATPSRGR